MSNETDRVKLSVEDAITVRSLERTLEKLGEPYFKWELCCTYAILGQLGMTLLAGATGLPMMLLAVPLAISVGLWTAAAVYFHVKRRRVIVPRAWLITAGRIDALPLPPDLHMHLGPYGVTRWSTARRWLIYWKNGVLMPDPAEIDSAMKASRKAAPGGGATRPRDNGAVRSSI